MAEEIKIIVGADTRQFNAELQKAENELRQFQNAIKKTTDLKELDALNKKINETQLTINKLNNSYKSVAPSANSASYAVTNLSRIVSDSAYGFIGIANNIQPFVDSLAAAKKEAQATGTSLGKNLIASLSGPGGLSLAFAAVTTAITFAQIGFSAWTRGAQKTKDTVDEIKKAQEDFAKSLDSAKSSALASGIALQNYADVAANSTLPIEQRNEALKKANEILGEHGEKLTLASVATAEGRKEIELYTNALIAQAVATKYTDQIANATIEQTKLNKQLVAAQVELTKAKIASDRADKVAAEAAKAGAVVYSIGREEAIKYSDALNNVKNIQLKLTNVQQTLSSSTDEAKKATEEATAAFAALGTKTNKTGKDIETLPEALAKFEKSLKNIQDVGISIGTPQIEINKDKIKEFEDILKKIVDKFNVKTDSKVYIDLVARLQDINYDNLLLRIKSEIESRKKLVLLPLDFKVKVPDIPIPDIAKKIKPIVIPVELKTQLDTVKGGIVPKSFAENVRKDLDQTKGEVKKAWLDYSNDIDKAATSTLTEAAANIGIAFGEALGAALTGGSFAKVFGNVFELLAGGVEALGKQLIQIGTLAVIAQQALAQLLANPFAAIAVGIALTALGAALKNLTQKSAFATGTRYAPGGMALVGERGPEMINLPRGSQVVPAAQTAHMLGGIGGQVEVFGVLRGQDIYFSNKKYSQTYNRTT